MNNELLAWTNRRLVAASHALMVCMKSRLVVTLFFAAIATDFLVSTAATAIISGSGSIRCSAAILKPESSRVIFISRRFLVDCLAYDPTYSTSPSITKKASHLPRNRGVVPLGSVPSDNILADAIQMRDAALTRLWVGWPMRSHVIEIQAGSVVGGVPLGRDHVAEFKAFITIPQFSGGGVGPLDSDTKNLPLFATIGINSNTGGIVLPYKSIWIMLAINVGLYFVIFEVLFIFYRYFLIEYRRYLNCCVRCSYNLRNINACRCPECGWILRRSGSETRDWCRSFCGPE